jgi:hypothetical protein
MSIRVDRTKDHRDRTPNAVQENAFDDAITAGDLTPEEWDAIVARFEADAAAVRRRTWRRRTSVRTSMYRRTYRKPNGCRL